MRSENDLNDLSRLTCARVLPLATPRDPFAPSDLSDPGDAQLQYSITFRIASSSRPFGE
jgi:hypothetical protein